jgi:hypothetical protein
MSASIVTTYLDETRAAAASSSEDKGITGGRQRCKRRGDGSTDAGTSGAEVLLDRIDWALGVGAEVVERAWL